MNEKKYRFFVEEIPQDEGENIWVLYRRERKPIPNTMIGLEGMMSDFYFVHLGEYASLEEANEERDLLEDKHGKCVE